MGERDRIIVNGEVLPQCSSGHGPEQYETISTIDQLCNTLPRRTVSSGGCERAMMVISLINRRAIRDLMGNTLLFFHKIYQFTSR